MHTNRKCHPELLPGEFLHHRTSKDGFVWDTAPVFRFEDLNLPKLALNIPGYGYRDCDSEYVYGNDMHIDAAYRAGRFRDDARNYAHPLCRAAYEMGLADGAEGLGDTSDD